MVQETQVQSQFYSYQRLKKSTDAALLNTQHYKVRIKGKVQQYREWSSTFPYTEGVEAIEKGAIGSPSTKVTNLTLVLSHFF